jgi:hypothetical protein
MADSNSTKDKNKKDNGDSNGSKARKRLPGLHVLDRAKEQLAVLTGRMPETVSSLAPSDDGWRLTIEVLEIEKIPDTTSVMASYGIEVDDDGNVLEFDFLSRYNRGQMDSES